MYISAEYMTSKDAGCELHVQYSYCIAGNFREAEIFAIFAIKGQLAKICSRENLFLQKFFADEPRTPSRVCLSRRSSKLTEKLS